MQIYLNIYYIGKTRYRVWSYTLLLTHNMFDGFDIRFECSVLRIELREYPITSHSIVNDD